MSAPQKRRTPPGRAGFEMSHKDAPGSAKQAYRRCPAAALAALLAGRTLVSAGFDDEPIQTAAMELRALGRVVTIKTWFKAARRGRVERLTVYRLAEVAQ